MYSYSSVLTDLICINLTCCGSHICRSFPILFCLFLLSAPGSLLVDYYCASSGGAVS